MKKPGQNFWKNLSTSHKISLIGSLMLIGSLFLKWFSDVDVFRSGDQYTGLNGPLYFVGINILIVGIANIAIILTKSTNWKFAEKFKESDFGKYQMIAGFAVMYLLMIVNSVYFHPQFGLNILSKKSEMGVFVAMLASVMMCVGGYLSFRTKFAMKEEAETVTENLEVRETAPVQDIETETVRPFAGGIKEAVQPEYEVPVTATASTNYEQPVAQPSPAPQTALRNSYQQPKTDYERSKAYEHLKKMMMKDTLTPDQRRKEREKQAKENAFSANFGKTEKVTVSSSVRATGGIDDLLRKGQLKKEAPAEKPAAKKPQMYRMDL